MVVDYALQQHTIACILMTMRTHSASCCCRLLHSLPDSSLIVSVYVQYWVSTQKTTDETFKSVTFNKVTATHLQGSRLVVAP
jgi:hypothetical protein